MPIHGTFAGTIGNARYRSNFTHSVTIRPARDTRATVWRAFTAQRMSAPLAHPSALRWGRTTYVPNVVRTKLDLGTAVEVVAPADAVANPNEHAVKLFASRFNRGHCSSPSPMLIFRIFTRLDKPSRDAGAQVACRWRHSRETTSAHARFHRVTAVAGVMFMGCCRSHSTFMALADS